MRQALVTCFAQNAKCGVSMKQLKDNKLKSLKVAQVKDEMDGDEDDGRNVVFDDVCRCM